MCTVVIVGGGVAGLTAGIFARKAGLSCRILEKHDIAGGNLTGWDRRGCHIDNCIHWLTGTRAGTPLYDLWREVGALGDGVDVYQPEAFFTSHYGGKRLSLWRDPQRTLRDMKALSPEDHYESERFIRAVEGLRVDSTVAERNIAVASYAFLTLDALADRFRHPLLRRVLTDYIAGEFSAVALVGAYAAFCDGNADIPVGGSRAMAQRMADRFTDLGGELLTSTAASRILTADGRAFGVLDVHGERHDAEVVICACDPAVTFKRLLDRKFAPYRWLSYCSHDEKLPMYSAVQAAFAVDAAAVPVGNHLYEMLPVDTGDASTWRMLFRSYGYAPTFAPEGRTVVQCLLPIHREACKRWITLSRDEKAYAEEKRRLADQIAERLLTVYPDSRPELLDCWTPATYRRYFGAPYGSFLSYALTPRAFLPRIAQTVPHLSNVFLATQWERAPGGLPTAAQAGRRVVQLIQKKTVLCR